MILLLLERVSVTRLFILGFFMNHILLGRDHPLSAILNVLLKIYKSIQNSMTLEVNGKKYTNFV
jgi:hypothetical protein